jgi:hypothetical protein
VMSLTYIGDQLRLYSGSVFLASGLIGNGMNIFIFSSVRTYLLTPCTFYFLMGSIDNTLYLLIMLITRIIAASYEIDLTHTSIIWCKARAFFAGSLSPISFTYSCLATIDQFLATSHSVNRRRYSKMRWTYRIVFVVVIVWCIHGIFPIFFYSISPTTNMCESNNAVYATYISIYLLVILCAIPVLIIVIFGCLVHRNIRHTIIFTQRHAVRHVTGMTLIQAVLVVISITPYGVFSTYHMITGGDIKDANRQSKENFVSTIVTMVSYLYYIVCLFLFFVMLFNTSFFELYI